MGYFFNLNNLLAFAFLLTLIAFMSPQKGWAMDLDRSQDERTRTMRNFEIALEAAEEAKENPLLAAKYYCRALVQAPSGTQAEIHKKFLNLLQTVEKIDNDTQTAICYYLFRYTQKEPKQFSLVPWKAYLTALHLNANGTKSVVVSPAILRKKLEMAVEDKNAKFYDKFAKFYLYTSTDQAVLNAALGWARKAFQSGDVKAAFTIVKFSKRQTRLFGGPNDKWAPFDTPIPIAYDPEKDPDKSDPLFLALST